MSHSASSKVGRKDYVPIRTALFSGGIALAVTFALITSPASGDGPREALATVGPVETVTTTTTAVPTTTSTTTTIPETTTTIDFGRAAQRRSGQRPAALRSSSLRPRPLRYPQPLVRVPPRPRSPPAPLLLELRQLQALRR